MITIPKKLAKLKNREVPIYEPGLDILFQRNIQQNRLEFTDDLKYAVTQSEFIFLALPTPQDENGSADLKYVFKVADEIGKIFSENGGDAQSKIIINKSTVPVGTSQKVFDEIKKYGVRNFDVASNPEFMREGFAVEDFMKPERVIIGASNPVTMERLKNYTIHFLELIKELLKWILQVLRFQNMLPIVISQCELLI